MSPRTAGAVADRKFNAAVRDAIRPCRVCQPGPRAPGCLLEGGHGPDSRFRRTPAVVAIIH